VGTLAGLAAINTAWLHKLQLDKNVYHFLIINNETRGASRGSAWLSWQTPLYRR